jgi:bile acid:Na+ symporter, BASS family
MSLQALLILVLKLSILLTVFCIGLRATGDDALYLLRRPRVLLRSMVAMFIAMPLFAVFITTKFEYHRAVEIALVALAISPVPPLLPRRVTKSGGKASYGLGLMVTAAVLSVVFVPLALKIIGLLFHKPFVMGPGAVVRLIATSVLVPLGAGMLFRKFAPHIASRIARPVGMVAAVLLGVGVLAAVVHVFPIAWSLIGNGTLFVFVLFIAFGLAVGHLLGGPGPDERVTLALGTACRHPALALAIGTANAPQETREVGAILLYLILNILVAIPYVSWQRRKNASSASSAPTSKAA